MKRAPSLTWLMPSLLSLATAGLTAQLCADSTPVNSTLTEEVTASAVASTNVSLASTNSGESLPQHDDFPQHNDEDESTQTSGHVIWHGEYLPPPYKLSSEDDRYWLNGRLLPALSPQSLAMTRAMPATRASSMNRFHRRPNNGGTPQGSPNVGSSALSVGLERFVDRFFERDGLLLVDENYTHLIRSSDATSILSILASNVNWEDKSERLESMFQGSHRAGHQVNWRHVAEMFEVPADLHEHFRVASIVPGQPSTDAPSTEATLDFSWLFTSRSVRYGMTVAGMALGVFGFGMLLQHRPHVGSREGKTDAIGEGFQMLPWYVVLVVVFAVFDLTCTLLAEGSGGLLELNPIGNGLLERPLALISLKIVATLGSAWILIHLRPYRLAQVTSWWLCLICVMLTLRWVMFNSMFLA